MIRSYDDFLRALLAAGFSQFGGQKDNVFSVLHAWDDHPPDSQIRWFSGDRDRDPWEWRMRVFAHSDIAYAKVFFRKSGFITQEWYPYFLAVRRPYGRAFGEAYADGLMSGYARRIHDTLRQNGPLPAHELRGAAGFGKEKGEKSAFERAVVELQMGLYVTLCGQAQKLDRKGEAYGWASNMLCLTEEFWPEEVFGQAARLAPEEAWEAIAAQVYRLNPGAEEKKVRRFIDG